MYYPPRLRSIDIRTPRRAILYGALTVGAFDLLDAVAFFGIRGVSPARILKGIAAGLVGPAARTGGTGMVLLGLVLHFCIAFAIVTAFYLLSRDRDWMLDHPAVSGPAYGIVVYIVMTFVVVPLSRAGHGPLTTAVVLNGLFIHMVGVGLPSALFARTVTVLRRAK